MKKGKGERDKKMEEGRRGGRGWKGKGDSGPC